MLTDAWRWIAAAGSTFVVACGARTLLEGAPPAHATDAGVEAGATRDAAVPEASAPPDVASIPEAGDAIEDADDAGALTFSGPRPCEASTDCWRAGLLTYGCYMGSCLCANSCNLPPGVTPYCSYSLGPVGACSPTAPPPSQDVQSCFGATPVCTRLTAQSGTCDGDASCWGCCAVDGSACVISTVTTCL